MTSENINVRNSRLPSVHIDIGSMRDSHIFILIFLVACIIYAKSIAYQYTYFDDIYLLVVNQEFLSNLSNIPRLFTTDVFISVANPEVFYRPLMNLLFMAEMQVSKDSLALFHITNIILHIGCSILLFDVFTRLKVSKHLAAAAAFLFCVHPLNTTAVVWIPGRNDTLLTLLALASFSMFLRALDTKRAWHTIGHMIFFFLALLTKETAFAIPILSVIYAFFIRRERLPRATIITFAVSYSVLLAVWFGLRTMVPRASEVHQSFVAVIMNWLNNVPGFALYFGKAFLPFNLSVFPNLTDQSFLLGAVSLLLFGAAYFIDRPASSRQLVWGLGWFFLFLAPALLSGNILYEHRSYCSLVGLLFAVTQLPAIQNINFTKPVNILGLVAVLAVFGLLAMVHSEHFRNRTAFATSAFVSSPSIDESYSDLAGLYLDEQNYPAAEHVLQAGLSRNPAMKAVHRMLGDVYASRHEYARAANEYETSIRLEPLQLFTYINYGKMCLEANRPDDAARLWKRSIVLNPEFLLGYEYLTNFYIYTRNDPDSAMIYARQIQQRGVAVMPELLHDIQKNPLYGKRK